MAEGRVRSVQACEVQVDKKPVQGGTKKNGTRNERATDKRCFFPGSPERITKKNKTERTLSAKMIPAYFLFLALLPGAIVILTHEWTQTPCIPKRLFPDNLVELGFL